MATSDRPTRHEWHQTDSGGWTRTIGDRGLRVRLFDKGGVYYRELYLPGGGKDRKSLGTTDRREADRLAKQLYSELLRGAVPAVAAATTVTLGGLWDRYRAGSQRFLDNKPKTRRDAETRAAILIAFFGAKRDVQYLTADDQLAYQRARMRGGIVYTLEDVYEVDGDGQPTQALKKFTTTAVRARSAEADLVLLHTMLTWATTHRTPSRQFLLDRNPLRGAARKSELNPVRPVTTYDRFLATRAAMQALAAAEAVGSEAWRRWVKMELALVLAEAAGRRLGAIRQLRWEDVDFEASEVTWRADSDKKGVMWIVPLPADLLAELAGFRRALGAIAGWVFNGERGTDRPMDRHLFDKWLIVAERHAALAKLVGGAWHPYRRKWAMERKHWPLADVAAVGGWKDIETLLKCYAQPDRATMLGVMNEPRKLGAADVGRRAGSADREALRRVAANAADELVAVGAAK